ncbi:MULTISPECIES: alkaline phosphatase family protein [Rhodococcus]|uniref:alkaline phosphatase family protein n=1 Tax=Rhodococcus TaxID=1827 RepID=UPI00067F72A3|nr:MULTISPECIES: nucleotide pyrophosphatase/phosphodiesterase family protein [Rhodococcus]MBT2268169.1 alkaline phosphatase family protein [Rhodococcus erythropolis]MEA1796999.1 alkaline phosphatase family protein [Rhodococcus qingshengii]
MPAPAPLLDVYSQPTLSTLAPSVLASLGVSGEANRLDLHPSKKTVILLVDGMGANLLARNAEHAPFLNSLVGTPIRAGFPTTTATSIVSLGTGLPSGAHGITGYQSYVEEADSVFNWLGWHSAGKKDSQTDSIVPETLQPQATTFDRAAAAGITVTTVVPSKFDGSGLTRAGMRGAQFAGIQAYGDLLARTVAASKSAERTFTYCYISEIDALGHVYGPESEPWIFQLMLVDRLVEQLAAALGPDVRLLVTADHGMVDVLDENKIDFDNTPMLSKDVLALAGEPRCRHIHTREGAARDVADRWRAELGDRMWIGTRSEGIVAGLFGPAVHSEYHGRIGDVIAIASGDVAVVRRSVESGLSGLRGQHGALTPDELLVPLLSSGQQ